MATVDDILNLAKAGTGGVHLETLANLLSGIAAQPISGLAGIGAGLAGSPNNRPISSRSAAVVAASASSFQLIAHSA
jgi:hypothetical protein